MHSPEPGGRTCSLDIFPLEHVPAGVRGYPVGVLGAADPVVIPLGYAPAAAGPQVPAYPVGVLGQAVVLPLVGC